MEELEREIKMSKAKEGNVKEDFDNKVLWCCPASDTCDGKDCNGKHKIPHAYNIFCERGARLNCPACVPVPADL